MTPGMPRSPLVLKDFFSSICPSKPLDYGAFTYFEGAKTRSKAATEEMDGAPNEVQGNANPANVEDETELRRGITTLLASLERKSLLELGDMVESSWGYGFLEYRDLCRILAYEVRFGFKVRKSDELAPDEAEVLAALSHHISPMGKKFRAFLRTRDRRVMEGMLHQKLPVAWFLLFSLSLFSLFSLVLSLSLSPPPPSSDACIFCHQGLLARLIFDGYMSCEEVQGLAEKQQVNIQDSHVPSFSNMK
jgi:hypothetical protein